jgi:hypothetical protein
MRRQLAIGMVLLGVALFCGSKRAMASTLSIYLQDGTLYYQCERTGDAIVTPDGGVTIPCGDNAIHIPGAAQFLTSPITFEYSSSAPLPVVRKGGSYGPLAAALSVSGPCSLDGDTAYFDNGGVQPRAPVPRVLPLPGVRSGTCSVALAPGGPGLNSLTAVITDSACHP